MEIQTPTGTRNLEVDGDDGNPPVLFLHGITQSSATWAWIVPHLVDRAQVYRLDFRGHGASARTPGQYLPADYRADAVAACEAIGRPVAVVGHSLGGGTAAGLAQHHPSLVRGIVLEDAPLQCEGEVLETSLLETFTLLREVVPQMQAAGMTPADVAAMLGAGPSAGGATLAETLTDDALATMAESLLQLDAQVLDPVIEASTGPFVDTRQPIDVPGVVLAADPSMPDHVTRPIDLERIGQHSPKMRTATVAGAGHLIHDSRDHRSTVLDIVVDFLDSID